jgi:hypothetical protein
MPLHHFRGVAAKQSRSLETVERVLDRRSSRPARNGGIRAGPAR